MIEQWRRWSRGHVGQLIRFGQAAAVNTAFGFGVFAVLIRGDMDPFLAQGIAQLLGVTFNYVIHRRHVFRVAPASPWSYGLAYGANYLINVALLTAFRQLIASVTVAGLVATLCAAVINYLALRSLVFRPRVALAR